MRRRMRKKRKLEEKKEIDFEEENTKPIPNKSKKSDFYLKFSKPNMS